MIYDPENLIADLIDAGYSVSTVTSAGEVQVKKIIEQNGKEIVAYEWVSDPKITEIVSRYSAVETPDPLAEIIKKLDDMNSRITAIEKGTKK